MLLKKKEIMEIKTLSKISAEKVNKEHFKVYTAGSKTD